MPENEDAEARFGCIPKQKATENAIITSRDAIFIGVWHEASVVKQFSGLRLCCIFQSPKRAMLLASRWTETSFFLCFVKGLKAKILQDFGVWNATAGFAPPFSAERNTIFCRTYQILTKRSNLPGEDGGRPAMPAKLRTCRHIPAACSAHRRPG